jgi:F-type H+-transporting ATPase subunit epsilon
MPDGTFAVSVLTPVAELFRADARALVLRSSDGDLTILDGHTPIVTDVAPGEVRVDLPEGDPVRLAVHGGYLHVETGPGLDGGEGRSTRATLLAGIAELATAIDVPRAERARAAAEARVEELRAVTGRGEGTAARAEGTSGGGDVAPTPEEIELAQAEADLRRAEVRLEVAGATTSA